MKVRALIEQLERYDPTVNVVVDFEGQSLKVMDVGRRERNGYVMPQVYTRALKPEEDHATL